MESKNDTTVNETNEIHAFCKAMNIPLEKLTEPNKRGMTRERRALYFFLYYHLDKSFSEMQVITRRHISTMSQQKSLFEYNLEERETLMWFADLIDKKNAIQKGDVNSLHNICTIAGS
jgi:hypothetical protein